MKRTKGETRALESSGGPRSDVRNWVGWDGGGRSIILKWW